MLPLRSLDVDVDEPIARSIQVWVEREQRSLIGDVGVLGLKVVYKFDPRQQTWRTRWLKSIWGSNPCTLDAGDGIEKGCGRFTAAPGQYSQLTHTSKALSGRKSNLNFNTQQIFAGWNNCSLKASMKSTGYKPVIPSGSSCRSQYQSWLTGSQPSVMDRTAYLPSSDSWMEEKTRADQSFCYHCWRTRDTIPTPKKVNIHVNNKTFPSELRRLDPASTYGNWTVPFGMFRKLCNQYVLCLLGADDVIVELLVDVGRGLGTCKVHVFILVGFF